MTVMVQASQMAYQGLWTAPWLAEVDGFDRNAVAGIAAGDGDRQWCSASC